MNPKDCQPMNDRLSGMNLGIIATLIIAVLLVMSPANAEPLDKCGFSGLTLPDDFAVFAAGDYSGRPLDWQIDQSGHQATRMDVVVNYAKKPVVLILGAYEPTVWNIRWAAGTKIIGVLVGGYHRQVVAGLAKSVPLLITTYDDQNDCGYFEVSRSSLESLNPLSRKHFGRSVNKVHFAKNGKVMVGGALSRGAKLLTSPENTPASYFDKSKPLAGPAGLKDALRKRLLRRATAKDVKAWYDAVVAKDANKDVPELADPHDRHVERPSVAGTYVVLKAFVFPAGLYGGNAASFIIPKGVPFPAGNPGHSTIYDFNTITLSWPGSRELIPAAPSAPGAP
jgi:hypothetical protein